MRLAAVALLLAASASVVSDMHPLKELPLIVLTKGLNSSPQWAALQADLVRLSTSSRQLVVADSDHEIHEIVTDHWPDEDVVTELDWTADHK